MNFLIHFLENYDLVVKLHYVVQLAKECLLRIVYISVNTIKSLHRCNCAFKIQFPSFANFLCHHHQTFIHSFIQWVSESVHTSVSQSVHPSTFLSVCLSISHSVTAFNSYWGIRNKMWNSEAKEKVAFVLLKSSMFLMLELSCTSKSTIVLFLWRGSGLLVSALLSGLSTPGLSSGRGHVLCS